jgi:hypothetical protein
LSDWVSVWANQWEYVLQVVDNKKLLLCDQCVRRKCFRVIWEIWESTSIVSYSTTKHRQNIYYKNENIGMCSQNNSFCWLPPPFVLFFSQRISTHITRNTFLIKYSIRLMNSFKWDEQLLLHIKCQIIRTDDDSLFSKLCVLYTIQYNITTFDWYEKHFKQCYWLCIIIIEFSQQLILFVLWKV